MIKFRGTAVALLCVMAPCASALTKSAGCGKALAAGIKKGGTGDSNNVTITSDEIKRTYLLHVPVNYNVDDPRGLIFSFHGRGENPVNQEELSEFSESDVNPDMLAVYPLGVDNEWQGDPDAETNDVLFVMDMLDSIAGSYCIDTDRVYAAGKSNGGGFSANILACDATASTKIAAFGGISGAYYQGEDINTCDGATFPITCNPGRKPIPIFETHGWVDPVIAYLGGPRRTRCLPSVPHFMTEWSIRNGLGSDNISTFMADDKVIKYEFGASSGQQGILTHYNISNLGHTWPSLAPNPDGCCSYINASQLLIAFFNKYDLQGVASTGSSSSTAAGASKSSTTTKASSSQASSKSASSSKETSKSTSSSQKAASSSVSPKVSTQPPWTSRASLTASQTTSSSKGMSTTSKTTSSSSIAASSYPSPTCPAANGTTFTTPEQARFSILCGYDTHGIPYGDPIYNLWNFGLCIKACEEDSKCGHVTYDGTCYLKTVNTGGIYATGSLVNRVAIKSTSLSKRTSRYGWWHRR